MNNFELKDIWKCSLCPLSGDSYAFPRMNRGIGPKVMFIGEAPGREEAKRHLTFVGPSGKELDRWISYMGVDNFYITNVVKHRPVKEGRDRPPTDNEAINCIPYLESEIEHERPDFIIVLGSVASHHVLHSPNPITRTVKEYFDNPNVHNGIRYLALFHPSYILRKRNESDNGEFEETFQSYLERIKNIISGVGP